MTFLQASASNYSFLSYHVPGENSTAMITEATSLSESARISLSTKLRGLFKEMEVQSK